MKFCPFSDTRIPVAAGKASCAHTAENLERQFRSLIAGWDLVDLVSAMDGQSKRKSPNVQSKSVKSFQTWDKHWRYLFHLHSISGQCSEVARTRTLEFTNSPNCGFILEPVQHYSVTGPGAESRPVLLWRHSVESWCELRSFSCGFLWTSMEFTGTDANSKLFVQVWSGFLQSAAIHSLPAPINSQIGRE